MGREIFCTSGRIIFDQYVVLEEGEYEAICCVLHVEIFVIIMW
jgi:hypothetical protein